MSAPVSCKDWDGQEESTPNWKDPCGQGMAMDNYTESESSAESIKSIDSVINPILTTTRMALDNMYNFRVPYVQKTFAVPYEVYQKMFNNSTHHWLPNRETEVPKTPGERVDPNHLRSLEFDKFLQGIYESMQKYAVGIEQVMWDRQAMDEQNFQKEFNETESNLSKVICELRTAMSERKIRPTSKVDRCIMDEKMRQMSSTAERNLRDWIILKECLNGLEYLSQVLEFFQSSPPS